MLRRPAYSLRRRGQGLRYKKDDFLSNVSRKLVFLPSEIAHHASLFPFCYLLAFFFLNPNSVPAQDFSTF